MESVTIKALARTETGKRGSRITRRNGGIPAIIYGDSTAIAVAVELNDVRHAIYTSDFKLVTIELDGETISCIVKDTQFHPVTEEIVHIDFLKLVPGNTIKVDVPVRFTGTSAGLRAGGKLIPKVRRLTIKTVPEQLLAEIVMDISHLELGQSIRVKDASVPEGVEILNPINNPVASVEIPRALRSAMDEDGGIQLDAGDDEASEDKAAPRESNDT